MDTNQLCPKLVTDNISKHSYIFLPAQIMLLVIAPLYELSWLQDALDTGGTLTHFKVFDTNPPHEVVPQPETMVSCQPTYSYPYNIRYI